MNKVLIASALLIAGALLLANIQVIPTTNPHQQYRDYLQRFNKVTPNDFEFLYRSSLFQKFLIQMEKHNSNPTQTWKMAVNEFSDLTQEEFVNTYLG